MFIGAIVIKNLRGFRDLSFTLGTNKQYAGWTVFTGNNGSGKSTLLKAIAVALTGPETARALQPSFHRWITDGEHEASIELTIIREKNDDVPSGKGRLEQGPFSAKISLKNGHTEPVITGSPQNPKRTVWSYDAKGWFCCGYGPFRRVFGASSSATRAMVATPTKHFVTMFQEEASLQEVDQWLRTLSHKALEQKSLEKQQLDVLLELFGSDLLPNQMTVDRVDSDGLWLKDRQGVRLSWSEMSDGYRAALVLLADIVRHLIEAYGVHGLTARDDAGKLVLTKSGVVLIDEIDAHLHPEWQREIGFWLTRHFPNIQFIVTTHSPLICQAARPNGLFVLPEPGSGFAPRALTSQEYKQVIASRPDTILLTPAFGLQNTRSPKAVQGRADYARLKAKERAGGALNAEEKAQLRQLQLFAQKETGD